MQRGALTRKDGVNGENESSDEEDYRSALQMYELREGLEVRRAGA